MDELLGSDPNNHYAASDPRRLVNAVDSENRTALYWAAQTGNERLLNMLLSYQADHMIAAVVDDDEEEWETPLECAARWGFRAIVVALLDAASHKHAVVKSAMKLSRSPSVRDVLQPHKKKKSRTERVISWLRKRGRLPGAEARRRRKRKEKRLKEWERSAMRSAGMDAL
eukprot:PLAT7227.3.p2 GENE.PLAT7227.3~~PLAT7227.3.p2  ORF type:complete len:185 (+),score=79.47 PLAT7227.3:46-555(+)